MFSLDFVVSGFVACSGFLLNLYSYLCFNSRVVQLVTQLPSQNVNLIEPDKSSRDAQKCKGG